MTKKTHRVRRNPQKTEADILSAATEEFATNGLDGARIDEIAKQSGYNKRMIYHYFGDKEGLFKAVLKEELSRGRKGIQTSPESFSDTIAFWFDRLREKKINVRLEQWEALQAKSQGIINEAERRKVFALAMKQTAESFNKAFPQANIDEDQLLLMLMAMNIYPLAFPQITKLITGIDPFDPAYRAKHLKFFENLGSFVSKSNK